MSEGPKTPLPDNIFRKMDASSNVHDLETGRTLTNREVAAEIRYKQKVDEQRQIGRREGKRFLNTTVGRISTGIGAIAVAAGLGLEAKNLMTYNSAEQEFSQRPVAVSGIEPGETTIESETKNEEGIPVMFVPGKTSFDLTEINIRSSAYNNNDPENYNKIDASQIEEIEGVPLDQDAKTMIVENAKLVNGKVGNNVDSRYFVAKAKINGKVVNIYLNYNLTKEQGYVLTEADKTHESGFITKAEGSYYGEVPRLNQEPKIVNPEEMNKVSFSTAPINNLPKQ